jgi:Protein of unknown function (DUF2924)
LLSTVGERPYLLPPAGLSKALQRCEISTVLRAREGASLRAGALMVREWKGRLERVMVLEEGFAWNGRTYRNLSQVAKAMTGTSWNGHPHLRLANVEVLSRCAPGRLLRGRCRHVAG